MIACSSLCAGGAEKNTIVMYVSPFCHFCFRTFDWDLTIRNSDSKGPTSETFGSKKEIVIPNQKRCFKIGNYDFKLENLVLTMKLWFQIIHLWLQNSKSNILHPYQKLCFQNQKFRFHTLKIKNSDSKLWKSEILILNQKFRFQTLKIRNSDSKSEILILNRKFWLQKLKIRNSDSKSEILIPNFENRKFWF